MMQYSLVNTVSYTRFTSEYRPYPMGVASRLPIVNFVAMVMPI